MNFNLFKKSCELVAFVQVPGPAIPDVILFDGKTYFAKHGAYSEAVVQTATKVGEPAVKK